MNTGAQLLVVAGLALAAAGGTYWMKGAPSRTLACDPAVLKEDEVCLADVVEPVVWIDARSRAAWERDGLEGSLLWNIDAGENLQEMEAAAVMRILENPRVVVYCDDENCGISRQVAERVAGLDLGAEVKVLHGGWRALREAGRIKGSS